ncbi:L-aminoadipate-semialdehyde dehydrogenase [Apiospora arundinis]
MYNQSTSSGSRNEVTVDPYALFEALTGRKVDNRASSSTLDEYDDLRDVHVSSGEIGKFPDPDKEPSDVCIGAINPYALVESMIGHRLEHHSRDCARIVSDVLQTDYDELFDLKHDSILYAGLKLDSKNKTAELLKSDDVKILDENDLVTPDLSRVEKLEDLEQVGLKGIGSTKVKLARLQNGKLRVVLDGHNLSKTVSNTQITMSVNELATMFRRSKDQWAPPNATWRHAEETARHQYQQKMFMDFNNRFNMNERPTGYINNMMRGRCSTVANRFDDPVQGALSNSWLIAAIFSVFWANPAIINRSTRSVSHNYDERDENRRRESQFEIKLHDKGGRNNNSTQNVKVNHEIPVNNSSMDSIYARSSDRMDIWPALYEKAFAKWITGDSSDRPDITQTAYGDPIKAMAQINGRKPRYFFTAERDHKELLGIVRASSVNFKTINPMAAYTYATGKMYKGSNIVANHAYSVLGWCQFGERSYVVLRNPWGVTEPLGLNSYPGLLDRVDPEFWRPACMLDSNGVLALECTEFQKLFACIGVAN